MSCVLSLDLVLYTGRGFLAMTRDKNARDQEYQGDDRPHERYLGYGRDAQVAIVEVEVGLTRCRCLVRGVGV